MKRRSREVHARPAHNSKRMTAAARALASGAIGLVTLLSAGLAHAIVSGLQLRGWLHGAYAAYPHQTMSGIVISAAIVSAAALFVGAGEALSACAFGRQDWLAGVAARIGAFSPGRTLVFVFAGQLCAIAAIESIEQTLALGHSLGIAAIFGAPIIAGLTIHAACALAATAITLLAARELVRACRTIRTVIAPLFRLGRHGGGAGPRHPERIAHQQAVPRQPPLALKIANRPPPHPLAA